jgi:hypothetical protein
VAARALWSGWTAALLLAVGVTAAEPVDGLVGTPLAPHPHARGATMFTELPPDETGVRLENRYDDPRMWAQLYQEFEGGSIGTGLAIGDYDGDGRPDLFAVSKTESCRLFRNRGGFKFEDVTDRAGVADVGPAAAIWKNGVTFVDVNNDGALDLYVCRFDAPNLLYINQRDGTFKEMAHAYGLDVKDASVMASFADYDRDGWLDVYVAMNMLSSTTAPNGQRGRLFHNNRDGTFTDVSARAGMLGEAQSHSATWWDFDNDGWPDLYVANDYGAPDRLYHNNRDGTFTDQLPTVLPHTGFYSMGSDLGDVNNDGRLDFLVADMAATSHLRDQQTIAESRDKSEDVPEGVAPKYRRSALFINTGTGRFQEAAILAGIEATDWTWSPRFADLDNDGRVDFFVTNGFNRDPSPDMHQRSMRAETTAERIRILKSAPVLNQTHLAFRNRGHLQFESIGPAWGLDRTGVSFASAFGDFGGDGNLDLVYSNYEANVSLFRNDCDTGHRVMIALRGTVSNRFGIGALVKLETAAGMQAEQLWLARGYMACSEPVLHFGLGPETVIHRLTVTWPSGHVQTFTNVAADQRLTITEPSAPPPPLAREDPPLPHGQFVDVSLATGLSVASREELVEETAQQRFLPIRMNRRGPALAVGPLRPGQPDDIIVGGTTVAPLQHLQRSGTDSFKVAEGSPLATGTEINDGPVLLLDVNGDGALDVLVTKGGNSLPPGLPEYQPRLFLNDGQGQLVPAPDDPVPPVTVSIGAAVAADWNRDGQVDVFLGGRVLTGQYPDAPPSTLLVNHRGRFEDVTDALAPGLRQVGMVTSALWSDVDGDGWSDLLLTLEWGPVKYFHNREGQGFDDWTDRAGFGAAGDGWWTSLAGADFNGDGRIDYVVGNIGLNTPYRASPSQPTLLYSGDFKGDGSSQLIEAICEGGKIYPRRTRRFLATAIPSLMKRFPLNATYAEATLAEVFGAGKIAAARRWAATELRSGVFLSQPDGTFRFAPLPHEAQIAPIQGIVAGDLDGDGHADIYAVQNMFGPVAPTGRFDGGLSQLLRGDGHGHFTIVPPADSMLVVPGDAKAAVTFDLDQDGWPDLLVSRNNGSTLAFRNTPVAGRHALRIDLHGQGGNPSAIGAQVTLELVSGRRQVAEVYAGSSFYSQSSAACFFGYPDGERPSRVTVRWPRGKSTVQEVPAGAAILPITEP